jgi:uncharacterized protein YacL
MLHYRNMNVDMDKYKPSETVLKMSYDNFVWAMVGIISGILLNNIAIKIFKMFNIVDDTMQNILQLMLCSVLLAYVHTNMNNYFGWTWQNVTPGLFFVSFFFGTQYKIFSNLSKYVTTL